MMKGFYLIHSRTVEEILAMAGKNTKGSSMRQTIVEEIVPSFCWSEDPTSHYLLVDLPGFKKEEVKLQIDNFGNIMVCGERQVVKENKVIRFKQTYKPPANSQVDQTTGKFEGEVLSVTLPRKIGERVPPAASDGIIRCDHPKLGPGAGRELGGDTTKIKLREKAGTAMEMLKKNKGIVITAVLAFSFGVFVSKSFLQSPPPSPNK